MQARFHGNLSDKRHAALARVAIVIAAGMVACGALADAARAAELLMFEQAGCVWCQRFEREIAPVYPHTEEGRLAPLRRIALGDEEAALADLTAPVRYAPTFVLVEDGREVGRIPGYAGEEAFWGLLAAMTKKLPRTP